jgi:hypothetical protein
MPTTAKEPTVKIVKLEAAHFEGDAATYGTADRETLIRRQYDGIYTWRVLRRNAAGGYTQVAREHTLQAAKKAAQVQA